MSSAEDEEQARRLGEFFRTIRQGHVFADPASPSGEPNQLVVISQTCDIVKPTRPSVTLARVVRLNDRPPGESPRYVSLPALADEGMYADLSYVDTFEKNRLLGIEPVDGVDQSDDDAKRRFSLALGRWFSRFPFPDELVPWLQPLEKLVRNRYEKTASPLGRVLRDVIVDIRVEAANWQTFPTALEIHLIARAEALPTTDEPPSMSDALRARLFTSGGEPKNPSEIAQIYESISDPMERALALGALAEACASICKPGRKHEDDEAVIGAVSDVSAVLWADDEFPLSRVRKSEPLDLDYLSEPTPLAE